MLYMITVLHYPPSLSLSLSLWVREKFLRIKSEKELSYAVKREKNPETKSEKENKNIQKFAEVKSECQNESYCKFQGVGSFIY